ncbi:hypothetical protein CSB92_4929 [Pseudomonas aeruginosa]|nr:hypothetical protein CSB91_0400 [Pseudomonas aeruginosa]AWF57571.1 hypothetical protein CSC30_5955 [Pseudomonas aeruginosa]AWF68472.1 hypothetical protein CSC27_1657 [Pseudomonas aeruginosa]PRW12244.1 hypothetical protein CSB92_4929 [Pseudomonas aeruginosa]QEO37414.1 Uncharacterized protein PAT169_3415 [Pseudomonas aeruginosa]
MYLLHRMTHVLLKNDFKFEMFFFASLIQYLRPKTSSI